MKAGRRRHGLGWLRALLVLLRRERRRGRRVQPSFQLIQISVTFFGGLAAVGLLGLLTVLSGEPPKPEKALMTLRPFLLENALISCIDVILQVPI